MLTFTKPILPVLFISILTTACSRSGSNGNSNVTTPETNQKTAFSLSGTISTVSGSAVDIDVNDPSRQNKHDPDSNFQTNDSIIKAQVLPNPAILNGFVSSTGATTPESGTGNFANDADNSDYYSAMLVEGQFVSLRITDFDVDYPSTNDISLELYNSDLDLVRVSDSNTELPLLPLRLQAVVRIEINRTGSMGFVNVSMGRSRRWH